VVFGSRLVFSHTVIADPVVAYFAASPVTSCESGKVPGTTLFGGKIRGKEGNFRHFGRIGGACAFDDGKATASGQVCLQRFEGIDPHGSLVEASVCGVGFLCVGKKGVACSAVALAALRALRFSFLSWRK